MYNILGVLFLNVSLPILPMLDALLTLFWVPGSDKEWWEIVGALGRQRHVPSPVLNFTREEIDE